MVAKSSIYYIISNTLNSYQIEKLAESICKDFNVQFLLINKKYTEKNTLKDFLDKNDIEYKEYIYSSKLQLTSIIAKITIVLKKNKPNLIHCMLFEASLIGILSGYLAGIKSRYFTRMHSTFHHEYSKNAVRLDKMINRFSTKIIATSENVKKVLVTKEKVDPKKIVIINYGLTEEFFHKEKNTKFKEEFLSRHSIPKGRVYIGINSKLQQLKGFDTIFKSIPEIISNYPNIAFLFINARGPYYNNLLEIKNTYLDNIFILEFDKQIHQFYQAIDIFIHIPINSTIEAFGKTYIEAIAASVPSIFTKSGISNDFAKHKFNCLLIDYQNQNQLTNAIFTLLKNQELGKVLSENAYQTSKFYTFDNYVKNLTKAYLDGVGTAKG